MAKTTTRVQLELPDKSFQRLKSLKETTEAISYVEVIKASLRVYEAIVQEHKAGSVVHIKRTDGTEVAIFGMGG